MHVGRGISHLRMSFSSIGRVHGHQLFALLLVLHHLLDGGWIADLLYLCVLPLTLRLLCLCFRPLLAGTLQQIHITGSDLHTQD